MFWLLLLSIIINLILTMYVVFNIGLQKLYNDAISVIELQEKRNKNAQDLLEINKKLLDVLQQQSVSDGWKEMDEYFKRRFGRS